MGLPELTRYSSRPPLKLCLSHLSDHCRLWSKYKVREFIKVLNFINARMRLVTYIHLAKNEMRDVASQASSSRASS